MSHIFSEEFEDIQPPEEGTVFLAGHPLKAPLQKPHKEAVIAALETVYDPEIPVNIYELGLIYTLELCDNGDVKVAMTLTAPACPVAGELPQQVADAVAAAEGVGSVTVSLTWDPPWRMEMMSEDARAALGFF